MAPLSGDSTARVRSSTGVVIALGLALLVSGCGGGGQATLGRLSQSRALEFVMNSTSLAFKQSTARITIQGAFAARGRSVPVSGSGRVHFTNGDMYMSMNVAEMGRTVNIRELEAGGNVYIDLIEDGHNLSTLTGKQWILLASTGSGPDSNPVAMMRTYKRYGATVRELPSQVVHGVACRAFQVTMSRAAVRHSYLVAAIREHLSAARRAATLRLLADRPRPSVVVMFDAAGRLRRLTVSVDTGVSKGQVAIDFSGFGSALAPIASPPANEVMTWASFVALEKSMT